jgi:membrane dipeptidase
MTPFIIDAHQDLAWNMLTFGRDYSQTVAETRQREQDTFAVENNGDSTISWHEYQKGRIALVFATLFAAPHKAKAGEWDSETYQTSREAHQLYKKQLDVYDRLFDQHPNEFAPVRSNRDLTTLFEGWKTLPGPHPTGLVTLMEGGDGIRSIDELDEWWERGVRIIGPAWMATYYCGGTREPGPLTAAGHSLLNGMAERGFSLDISHMAWESALEALDRYPGPILASHANPLKMVKNGTSNRFLTDEIIDHLLERDGTIGIVPFNRFLDQNWKNSDPRQNCSLEMVATHIDYICQRAGNAQHVGFGTDFDGGFGLQHIPPEMDTIADLQKLAPILSARGYSDRDIENIFGKNWLTHLEKSLPA